jgi:hypothetical protein
MPILVCLSKQNNTAFDDHFWNLGSISLQAKYVKHVEDSHDITIVVFNHAFRSLIIKITLLLFFTKFVMVLFASRFKRSKKYTNVSPRYAKWPNYSLPSIFVTRNINITFIVIFLSFVSAKKYNDWCICSLLVVTIYTAIH